MNYSDRLRLVRQVLPLIMKTHTNQQGRVFLRSSNNKWIFHQLRLLGCFEFYATNNGHIVGLSQIVAFLSYGWKAYKNGFTASKDEIEVHHIDGDVTNNDSDNLVYLSREDHQVVSDISYTPFYGKVNYIGCTPFNKHGRATSNPTHFLVNIIQETVSAVSSRRSKIKLHIPYSDVLLNLPKTLWKTSRNLRVLPNWINSTVQSIICPQLNLYA